MTHRFALAAVSLGLTLLACAPQEEAAKEAPARTASALSTPTARCTMQSLGECSPAPDVLCQQVERVDDPGADAAGCAFLRDVGTCFCPTRAAPQPQPQPAIFVCSPGDPGAPVDFEGRTRWCQPQPDYQCQEYDHGVPIEARPPWTAGCIRQFGGPYAGPCWCPAN